MASFFIVAISRWRALVEKRLRAIEALRPDLMANPPDPPLHPVLVVQHEQPQISLQIAGFVVHDADAGLENATMVMNEANPSKE